MIWIKSKPDVMRSDIETRTEFVARNLDWWWENRKFERIRRKKYYNRFLAFENTYLSIKPNLTIAEVGPGPFGGIIEVCKLPVAPKNKIFIDYIMEDLVNLKFINWPEDATYVEAPAEKIPLGSNTVDVLISYNAIDHGWDTFRAIKECVRVSKRCFLGFDCRGDDPKQKKDKDHHQLLKFECVSQFVFEMGMNSGQHQMWQIQDMDFKQFPVAFISVEKI